MAQADYIQHSFNGGEISPHVHGQLDMVKYLSGLDLVKNWVCLPHGPVQFRSGTEFINEVKNSSAPVRLIPFEFNIDQAYIIEAGDGYMRFFADGGRIETQEHIRNGSMEEDDWWFDVATPTTNERSKAQIYSGEYSRYFVSNGAGDGIATAPDDESAVNTFNVESAILHTCSLAIRPSVASMDVVLQYLNPAGTPLSVWEDGSYIYNACDGDGIYAYSFNGSTFTNAGSKDDGGHYYDVWGDGTYIYVACGGDGLRAYTFNGSAFTLLDTIDDGGTYRAVWGDGSYIYAACDSSGVRAYSFNGTSFTLLDTYAGALAATNLWHDGTYLYIANDTAGMIIVSFNGTSFTYRHDIVSSPHNAQDVFGDGTYIYLVINTGSTYYINAYDEYNGSSFTYRGAVTGSGTSSRLFCDSANVYIACLGDGLRAYSFNGSSFTLDGSVDDGGSANGVWGDGSYLYLVNQDDGLRAYTFNGSTFTGVGHIADGSYQAEHTENITGMTTGVWQKETFTFTPSVDHSICRLAIISSVADPAGNFYIDEVCLTTAAICEIVTPFTYPATFEKDFAQSVDEIYFAHGDHVPRKLERHNHNAWFMDYHNFALSIRNASYTWTLSGSGTNEYYLRTSDSLDPEVNKPFGVTQGFGRVYGPNTVYFAEGAIGSLAVNEWGYGDNDSLGYSTIYVRLSSGADPDTLSANKLWASNWPDEWSALNGYPQTLTFHGDRLYYAGSEKRPQRCWGSNVSNYKDFTRADPVEDDDGLNLNLGDGQVNQILYLRSQRGIIAFTPAPEYLITGSDGTEVITANSRRAVVASSSSSDKVRPVNIDNTLVHTLRHKQKIKELFYDYEKEAFGGNELTIFAEHLSRNYDITDMAYQRTPYKVLWCVRSDGALLGLTYYPQHKVFGWHRHEIGGNGEVESIAIIPGDGYDELWMVVKRTVNSATKRYIERLRAFFVKPEINVDYFMDDDTTDAIFLDSSLTLDNRVNISSISSADPAVITTEDNHGWSNGDTVRIRNVKGLIDGNGDSAVNGLDFTVANKTDNTAELQDAGGDFDSTSLTAYISGGTAAKKVTSISGLDHLEGETVDILGDGKQITSEVVSSGSITLDSAASVVHIGLSYNGDIRTLPPRISQQVGTYQAVNKQIKAFVLRLFETGGLSVGRDENNLVDITHPTPDNVTVPSGNPTPLYDGDTEELSFMGGYSTQPDIFIRQSSPLPATISAIIQQLEV